MVPSCSTEVIPPIPFSAYSPVYQREATMRSRKSLHLKQSYHSFFNHNKLLIGHVGIKMVVSANDPIVRRRVRLDLLNSLNNLRREFNIVRNDATRRLARPSRGCRTQRTSITIHCVSAIPKPSFVASAINTLPAERTAIRRDSAASHESLRPSVSTQASQLISLLPLIAFSSQIHVPE